jgi:hypothetical protein
MRLSSIDERGKRENDVSLDIFLAKVKMIFGKHLGVIKEL